MTTLPPLGRQLLLGTACAAALACAPVQAAGLLDSLFGKSEPTVDAKRKIWRVREFTTLQVVPRETGADTPANQHPVTLQPEALRQQLLLIQKLDPRGNDPLFDKDEAEELSVPLTQALANAGPDEDVQLLSSARRGTLGPPRALTARVFVQGDALNLIVNDTDLDFVVAYRSTNMLPKFQYGSRAQASKARLQSPAATSKRPDWVALPLAGLQAVVLTQPVAVPAAPAPAPAPAATPAAVPAPAAPAAVVAKPAAAPAAAAAAVKPGDIEERLATLKRLFDKGLISAEEYQQKRKELLQAL